MQISNTRAIPELLADGARHSLLSTLNYRDNPKVHLWLLPGSPTSHIVFAGSITIHPPIYARSFPGRLCNCFRAVMLTRPRGPLQEGLG